MGEDHDPRARDSQRDHVLRGGRDHGAAAAASAGAAGAVPEVPDRVPGEEAAGVPPLLLRVGPRLAGDPGAGVRLPHHSGAPAERVRQHKERHLPPEGVRQDSPDQLPRTGNHRPGETGARVRQRGALAGGAAPAVAELGPLRHPRGSSGHRRPKLQPARVRGELPRPGGHPRHPDAVDQGRGECAHERAAGQAHHGRHQPGLPRHPEHAHRPDHPRPHQDQPRPLRDADHHPRAPARHLRRSGEDARENADGLRVAEAESLLLQGGRGSLRHLHHGRELRLPERVPRLHGPARHHAPHGQVLHHALAGAGNGAGGRARGAGRYR